MPSCTKCGFDPAPPDVLPPTDTRPIHELQRARLAQFDRQIAQIQSYLSAVQAERQALQTTLGEIVYPILTLPTELTSMIFVHCLPIHGRVRPSADAAPLLLAQVCHDWREIVLGTATLWKSAEFAFEYEDSYTGAGQILSTWFPRAVGGPLSLTIHSDRDHDPDLLPAIVPSILTFQAQFVRLEHCLPVEDFHMLKATGASFPTLRTLSVALPDYYEDSHAAAAFPDCPTLRELCLGKGFSLPSMKTGTQITPLLTTLELSQSVSFDDMLVLVQRFPQLEHLTARANNKDPTAPAEVQTLLQLRALNIAFLSHVFDRLKLPNVQSLDFRLDIFCSAAFHSLISRSTCVLQHLTLHALHASDGSEKQLKKCLSAVPSLATLKVDDYSRDNANFVFECLCSPSVVPNLRALMICTTGPLDYSLLLLMIDARPDTALRTIRILLDIEDYDVSNSYDDGGWLPSQIFQSALEDRGLSFYVETPDGVWPGALKHTCRHFPSDLYYLRL